MGPITVMRSHDGLRGTHHTNEVPIMTAEPWGPVRSGTLRCIRCCPTQHLPVLVKSK